MAATNGRDLYNATTLDSLHTATEVFVVTPGATALTKPVRWLRCSAAENVTITTFADSSVVLKFTAGETRFVGATHVTAQSGSGVIEGMV